MQYTHFLPNTHDISFICDLKNSQNIILSSKNVKKLTK